MRLIKQLHFEKLKPLCPICCSNGQESFLEIRSVLKESNNSIIEGILSCTNTQCLSEYPVIDGMPIIVSNLRTYISQNLIPILCRDDLTNTMETLLGDCFGPGSAFDSHRQHISTYAFDHYGDLDPEETTKSPALPGSIVKLLRRSLLSMEHKVRGPVTEKIFAEFQQGKQREKERLSILKDRLKEQSRFCKAALIQRVPRIVF